MVRQPKPQSTNRSDFLFAWFPTHPVSSLHRPHQVDPFPHVDVTVQGTWIRDLVLGAREAEDGLEIPRFAENATFRCESITA